MKMRNQEWRRTKGNKRDKRLQFVFGLFIKTTKKHFCCWSSMRTEYKFPIPEWTYKCNNWTVEINQFWAYLLYQNYSNVISNSRFLRPVLLFINPSLLLHLHLLLSYPCDVSSLVFSPPQVFPCIRLFTIVTTDWLRQSNLSYVSIQTIHHLSQMSSHRSKTGNEMRDDSIVGWQLSVFCLGWLIEISKINSRKVKISTDCLNSNDSRITLLLSSINS